MYFKLTVRVHPQSYVFAQKGKQMKSRILSDRYDCHINAVRREVTAMAVFIFSIVVVYCFLAFCLWKCCLYGCGNRQSCAVVLFKVVFLVYNDYPILLYYYFHLVFCSSTVKVKKRFLGGTQGCESALIFCGSGSSCYV